MRFFAWHIIRLVATRERHPSWFWLLLQPEPGIVGDSRIHRADVLDVTDPTPFHVFILFVIIACVSYFQSKAQGTGEAAGA
jgi:hypothetical protein